VLPEVTVEALLPMPLLSVSQDSLVQLLLLFWLEKTLQLAQAKN